MTTAPDLRRAEFTRALQALAPRGRVWNAEPGAVQSRFWGAFGGVLETFHGRTRALSEAEADPAQAVEALADWERAYGLPDPCLPLETFTRASTATYFDSTGTLQTAAAGVARFGYDPVTLAPLGLLVEGAGANCAWNPRAEGLTTGAPGSLPSYWKNGGIFGQQIVGASAESGIPGFDLRINGTTPAGGSYWWIQPAGWMAGTYIVASPGQTWTFSVYLRVMAGAMPSGSAIRVQLDWFDAGGSNFTSNALNITPGAGALRMQRYTIAAVAPATTARVGISIAQNLSGSQAVDMTLRIAAPQIEQDAVSSLVLPPIGSPAISTRAADIHVVRTADQRRASLLQRIAERPGQSKAYFIGLAAQLGQTITIDEFRVTRVEEMRADDPIQGPEFNFSWRVNGAGISASYLRAEQPVEAPLASYTDSPLACLFGRLKPARTQVFFA